MRILHVIWSMSPEAGGPPAAVKGLSGELVRLGHQTAIWTTEAGVESGVSEIAEGVEIRSFPLDGLKKWFYAPLMGKALRSEAAGFDIVHIHGVWLYPTTAAARTCRTGDVPYLIRPCGMLSRFSLARKSLKKRLYGFAVERSNLSGAAAVHFTSEREASESFLFGARPPTVVVPNGVPIADEPDGADRSGEFREKYGIGGRRYILYLGRLSEKKGLDLLCDGFLAAIGESSDVCLALAGPDEEPYARALKERTSEARRRGRIVFTGYLEGAEKQAAFSGAELFAHPSFDENFGMSIVEAMAAGLPVLVSDGVDLHGEIAESGAGCVVPLEVGKVAEGLRRLLGAPEAARKMGQRGRRLARERFGLRLVGDGMVRAYRRILETRKNKRDSHTGSTRPIADPGK